MLLDFELGTNAAHLHPRHLIEDLYKHQNEDDFAKTFDDTLNDIAVENNSIFRSIPLEILIFVYLKNGLSMISFVTVVCGMMLLSKS